MTIPEFLMSERANLTNETGSSSLLFFSVKIGSTRQEKKRLVSWMRQRRAIIPFECTYNVYVCFSFFYCKKHYEQKSD